MRKKPPLSKTQRIKELTELIKDVKEIEDFNPEVIKNYETQLNELKQNGK